MAQDYIFGIPIPDDDACTGITSVDDGVTRHEGEACPVHETNLAVEAQRLAEQAQAEPAQDDPEIMVSLPASQWALVKPFMRDVASDFESTEAERQAFIDLDDAIENAQSRFYEEANR